MTYIANIPQATDKLSTSQTQIKNNFTALNDIYQRNHYAYTVGATVDTGKHKFIEMVNSGNASLSPPTPTTVPAGLADKTGTIYTLRQSSKSDIYYSNDNSGRTYKITNVVGSSDYATCGIGPNGWTWMGQGIIMQYGTFSHTTEQEITVTFPVTFGITPYSIQASGIVSSSADPNARASIGIRAVTTTQFIARMTTNSSLTGVYWTAIGFF